VILVSREKKIGGSLGEWAQSTVERSLSRLGVETLAGSAVASIDAGGITTTTGQRIEALTVVWAAGMASSPLTDSIDGERDSYGRLQVDSNLRVPNTKEIFAAGDAACAVVDEDGNTTVMSSQYAQNTGRASGYNAAADLLGLPLISYRQSVYLMCVDLGPNEAIVTVGWDRRVVISGILAKKIKNYINDTLALPPGPNKDKALAAAKMPSDLGLRVVGSLLSAVASIRSIF
jgi:NADH dehydrogenase